MNRRLALGILGLGLLALTAGCTSFLGPGEPDPGDLTANETYDWDAGVDADLDVNKRNVTAVFDVRNRTDGLDDSDPTFRFYGRGTLATEQPQRLTAVQFRYANGTQVAFESVDGEARSVVTYTNGTTAQLPVLSVERTNDRTVVHLPTNESGQLGVTLPKDGKQVSFPGYVEGSYQMRLPESARVGVPLLSQVRPGTSDRTVANDRLLLSWEGVDAPTLVVRYYLQRDLLLFGGLAVGATLIGLGGALYYYRQLRATQKKREEVGLDMDIEDDDRNRPPPGMG
ncbi:DUF5803 family protein [Halosegnis rubeus]|jgi:hypothetical protein|uniref:Lipoprotein n=1 Tax=Halosegnis rubeus TaxID=2212850 RepID=A0A5N5UI60_9EURY|nr:DUF5803 family protein [Halosegnis rubeus]KAB7517311.1 hypothetical protein DP108_09870 [Halosegnis rubeus]